MRVQDHFNVNSNKWCLGFVQKTNITKDTHLKAKYKMLEFMVQSNIMTVKMYIA